ncbi:hypothetical protein L7F22_037907 [Adiantum nelumboides]|nr:hypothetical protein [Adiantum nelumboides]
MLGQLSFFRRWGQQLTQGIFLRGVATQKQVRRNKPTPAPAPPPDPPEKIEWWAVDGELVKAEKFDPNRVLAPLEHEHISNRKRRKELMRQLRRTRLNFKVHDWDLIFQPLQEGLQHIFDTGVSISIQASSFVVGSIVALWFGGFLLKCVIDESKNQVPYWAAYMQRFQVLREEWEKLVWDPIPVPPPKRRQPTWLAEETEKYVWQDPRREAFVASRNATQDPTASAYTFDLSRMDRSEVREKFDEKIGYKRQAMSHSPFENRRDPGASGARPLHQRTVDFTRRKLRPTEFMDFDDVFNNEDDNKDPNKNHSHAKTVLSATEDEDVSGEEALFSWDESDSEEDAGDKWEAAGQDDEDGFVDGARHKAKAAGKDEGEDEDSVDGGSEVEDFQTDKKGWFGEEDDLFKDDE